MTQSTWTKRSTLGILVFGVLVCLSSEAAVENEVLSPTREPASERASVEKVSTEAKMDPVTRALYQSLDERARSQRDFERHEALGRPKDIRDKKQLRIELGDELGGGVFPQNRSSRQVRARGLEFDGTIPAIESHLDRESRTVREEIRRDKDENRGELERRERSPRSSHWIDN